jgi:3-hydroxybutyryl-CoA dehydrogenase
MSEKSKQKAVIVGAGTMGSGIALFLAAAGWRTIVVDMNDRVREKFKDEMLTSIQRIGGDPAKADIIAVSRLEEVDWTGTEIVFESIIEDLDAKRKLFATLERLAPKLVPLASNSTGYPIGSIGEGLATRDRMIGVHFLMPAQFVPLVEIIPSEETSLEIVERVRSLLASVGKRPVVLKKPLVGFLANRMQSALMREALSLIDRGVASARDVDDAVRYSFGFRYAAAGPIMQKEHSGWDISMGLYEKVFPDLCNDAAPTRSVRAMVEAGKLGMKTGEGFFDWSDESLVAAEKLRFETALGAVLKILK